MASYIGGHVVRRLVALIVVGGVFGFTQSPHAQTARDNGDRVILVTVDGARTQEIFGGMDLDVFRSTLKDPATIESTETYKKFWAASPEERRRKLMPFFWSLVSKDGSIAGDHHAGSSVRLRNGHWFSYPGYAEILLGEPHDDAIKSNDAIRNPYTTVLETIRERLQLPSTSVATFASWSVFNQIAEHHEGTILINAGPGSVTGVTGEASRMAALQREIPSPWENNRFDAFTFHLAMDYLRTVKPRVLYVAFNDTDDWAHDGYYDRVLDAYARIDGYLSELWTWVQSDPEYRGRTHLLITADHGRGRTAQDWRDHNAKTEGSQDTWIALVSPRMDRRGEWGEASALSTSQIAATLADWMGIDWNSDHPNAGHVIR
jgi:hypothetical protein